MEPLQSLAIESFSHSWLTNVNSSLDGLENKTVKSKRSFEEAQNFKFDVPISQQSPDALAPADQLFSDGLLRPVFINHTKIETSNSTDLAPVMPSFTSKTGVSAVLIHCRFLSRWRQSLRKCFGYVRQARYRIKSSRKSMKVDDIDRRAGERQRTGYLVEDRCDIESSIHEAVLHCKRSMDK